MSENQNPNNDEGGIQQQVYKDNTNTAPPTPKPQSEEEQRPEDGGLLRQHERHILFHFFTLFSISFCIGVLIIHLSMWINANYLSSVTTYSHNDVTHTFHNHHVTTSSAPPNYNDDDVTYDDEKKNDVTSGGELNLWFEPVRLTPSLYDVITDGGTGGGVKVIVNSWNMTSSASRML